MTNNKEEQKNEHSIQEYIKARVFVSCRQNTSSRQTMAKLKLSCY